MPLVVDCFPFVRVFHQSLMDEFFKFQFSSEKLYLDKGNKRRFFGYRKRKRQRGGPSLHEARSMGNHRGTLRLIRCVSQEKCAAEKGKKRGVEHQEILRPTGECPSKTHTIEHFHYNIATKIGTKEKHTRKGANHLKSPTALHLQFRDGHRWGCWC